MKFVVATKDYAGLGFAIRLHDEGHEVVLATEPDPDDVGDPERQSAFDLVGQGLIRKQPLHETIRNREHMRDWYWIWDFNHNVNQNERLRREGFKVFGGGEFANCMEHDRQACLHFASTYGLEAPPSFKFAETKEAIA